MSEPTLKAAAAEISAVLKKYDLAALVTLQSPTGMEYLREIAPTWSCARIEETPDGYGIRIRSKRADDPAQPRRDGHLDDRELQGLSRRQRALPHRNRRPVGSNMVARGQAGDARRSATSMETGLPLLREACDQEKPEERAAAHAEIDRRLVVAFTLLPDGDFEEEDPLARAEFPA